MANIKKLKENGQDIVPITHEQAVLDSNGVTLESKLNAISNAISRLENNSSSNAPSLEGNTLTFGNYTITYNETNDTLDFIYNGVIDNPGTGGTTPNSYVTNGLSMYIDANDVTTYGSVRDITGKQTVTNHGATLTSDNKYLNFVSTESDYLDTDFVPNLTQWSAEVYFYFTEMPTSSENVFTWGENPNQIRVAYSGSKKIFAIQCNSGTNYKITDNANILTPHHLILTMNNGTITSYYDGVKSIITSEGAVQTSPQTLTLKIGGNYSATSNFANLNLRMFRFYDGKVLTDEEALQNYNYEINRN